MSLTGRQPYQKQGKTAKPKKRVRPVSAKRQAHYRSPEGKAGVLYMGVVKTLPCAVCGAYGPSDAHHCIMNRYGTAKASDFDVIPLCKPHHQDGPEAIHNGKQTWRNKHGADHGYIPATRAAVKRLVNAETWAQFEAARKSTNPIDDP